MSILPRNIWVGFGFQVVLGVDVGGETDGEIVNNRRASMRGGLPVHAIHSVRVRYTPVDQKSVHFKDARQSHTGETLPCINRLGIFAL